MQLKLKDLKTQHKELVAAVKMAEDALVQVSQILQMMENLKEVSCGLYIAMKTGNSHIQPSVTYR